jgi:glycosyltransferase involved in cell wall biosynthesis
MRIAICLPALPLSGVGTSVGILCGGLKAAGYEVDVVVTGDRPGEDLQQAGTAGCNTILVGAGERFLLNRLRAMVDYLNHGSYDVVLNNTSMETQLVLPCLNSNLHRVSVLRVLNGDALQHIGINSAYLHTAVGISREMVKVMVSDHRIQAPVRLIPNCTSGTGGDFPRFNGRVEICYVGRLSIPDKNIMVLPDIARELNRRGVRFRLRIVGEGPAAG